MKKLFLLFACCWAISANAQPADAGRDLQVVFYNVENLFDTLDDPRTTDESFTPRGANTWTGWRYRQKLIALYKTFTALGGWASPSLIGLCEVEDRRTLVDLLRYTPLRSEGFGIVCEPSADARGIEVGLLYRKENFKYVCHQLLRPRFVFDTAARTRDVLYVAGQLPNGDTLHVFVNHWPSRRGGQAASEPRRLAVARMVRAHVDSLLAENPSASILIMGDLNDTPDDPSVAQVLRVKTDTLPQTDGSLYELMRPHGLVAGTHKHEGEWAILDHLIASTGLVAQRPGHWHISLGEVFVAPFLLEADLRNTGTRPRRTFAGPRYLGGFSDHLPVRARLHYISEMSGANPSE